MIDVAFSTVISNYTLSVVGNNLLLHPLYFKFNRMIKPVDPLTLYDMSKKLEVVVDKKKPRVINVFFGDYLYDISKQYRDIASDILSTYSQKKVLTTFPLFSPSKIKSINDVFDSLINSATLNIIENDVFFDEFDMINFVYFPSKGNIHYIYTLANAIIFASTHEIAISRVASKNDFSNVKKEFDMINELVTCTMNIIPSDIESYYYYKIKSMKYKWFVEPNKRISVFPFPKNNFIYSYQLLA